jgi:hypothetical protein
MRLDWASIGKAKARVVWHFVPLCAIPGVVSLEEKGVGIHFRGAHVSNLFYYLLICRNVGSSGLARKQGFYANVQFPDNFQLLRQRIICHSPACDVSVLPDAHSLRLTFNHLSVNSYFLLEITGMDSEGKNWPKEHEAKVTSDVTPQKPQRVERWVWLGVISRKDAFRRILSRWWLPLFCFLYQAATNTTVSFEKWWPLHLLAWFIGWGILYLGMYHLGTFLRLRRFSFLYKITDNYNAIFSRSNS